MDPLPDGSGFRGWADRLAEILAAIEPDLLYANLAVRGKLARQVRETQLERRAGAGARPRLACSPGLNDMLRRNVDVAAVIGELDGDGRARCATPAPTCSCSRSRTRCRSTRWPRPPRRAWRGINDAIREIAARRGDVPRRARRARRLLRPPAVERGPPAREPGGPPPDRGRRRPCARAAGHRHVLDRPPSPTRSAAARAARTCVWFGRYFTPWLIRRLRGRSSGDGRVAKRPELEPLRASHASASFVGPARLG